MKELTNKLISEGKMITMNENHNTEIINYKGYCDYRTGSVIAIHPITREKILIGTIQINKDNIEENRNLLWKKECVI